MPSRRLLMSCHPTASTSSALPPAFLESNPHLMALPSFKRAQALLHVSATPEFLPCREKQRDQVAGFVAEHVISGTGSCLCKRFWPDLVLFTATIDVLLTGLQTSTEFQELGKLLQCTPSFVNFRTIL